MEHTTKTIAFKRQVLSFYLYVCISQAVCETIRYSIAEEMEIGSFVANIANDLGLDNKKLSLRRAHIVSEENKQYFQLVPNSGDLLIKEKLDREELCRQTERCTSHFEILLEKPLQFFRVEVQIYDVNDNSPVFSEDEVVLQILETAAVGSRFPLEAARDSDMGSNSLKEYTLSSSEHFHLHIQNRSDGGKYAELVLVKPLDREKQPEIRLLLTAMDGGSPPRSGTAQIRIIVTDANDNPPVFTQELYKVFLLENTPVDGLVANVSATDLDHGINGKILYSFSQKSEENRQQFNINQENGEIKLKSPLDFEAIQIFEIQIQAVDGGGLSAHCKVLVEVVDVNDNAPEITVTSLTRSIPEDSQPETVVALFSIRDKDSGKNGKTVCSIPDHVPFALKSTFKDYYALVTQSHLDRETWSEYNITITAMDSGSPSLTSQETIRVQILDINDNPPMFNQSSYSFYMMENNKPSLLIGSVNAFDLDSEQNAKVQYSLLPGQIGELTLSSYISVNYDNGDLYVLRSLDYEDIRDFHVVVKAQDGGFPPLVNKVDVRVFIIDVNDNAPFILNPLQNSSSPTSELVPKSADTGYLVTKVVAVDMDAGQNAWLFYQLMKSTDPGLFSVGHHTGEIRVTKPITQRDPIKQKLVILVRDNGQPCLSTSTILNVLLVDGFSGAYLELVDPPGKEEDEDPLTLYLVISLVLISFIFLVSVLVFIICKTALKRDFRERYIPAPGNYYSDANFPTVDVTSTGTLSESFRYEVCLTSGSGNSEFKCLKPLIPNLPTHQSNTGLKNEMDPDFHTENNLRNDAESFTQNKLESLENVVHHQNIQIFNSPKKRFTTPVEMFHRYFLENLSIKESLLPPISKAYYVPLNEKDQGIKHVFFDPSQLKAFLNDKSRWGSGSLNAKPVIFHDL
ncbi:protocadherin beta-16-like [Rhinatrema bivittatum]|uniref:protocadherin beta-16-like n=1 Tax=Rhinatrema bivittatum TaxID=194408 RepID=UPI00112AFB91|nr:protocadherin beta-16-like [Rhinatrema bivittatum]